MPKKYGSDSPWTFYEFFAGGGMARLGLGTSWKCLLSNEWCPKKAHAYRKNFGPSPELVVEDIRRIQLPSTAKSPDLVWASFPCQDLSLAGAGAGLSGERSGTFWGFWLLIQEMKAKRRGPRLVVLENVVGALTSNGGKDFSEILQALTSIGYKAGAIVMDAVHFVPQSRPRLFIIAALQNSVMPAEVVADAPTQPWHPRILRQAHSQIADRLKGRWIWWKLPQPPLRNANLIDVIEEAPSDVDWHSEQETQRLLGQMSAVNLAKVHEAQKSRQRMIGAVYKRTRIDDAGKKVQRAEVRFDDISGCLRTPAGGSSRQTIIVVENARARTRLLSSREAARLMGLPDDYKLPQNYNEAYHLCGDGLAVPVVRFLADNLLEPIAAKIRIASEAAA